jgi:acetyl esterase/lipase
MVQQLRPEADVWRQRGWVTLTLTHRPCMQSVADVAWYYQHLRQRVGPTVPICAMGQSSGAHLVLLLAGLAPDLDCAISQAGPLDLVRLPFQLAYDDLTDEDGDAPPIGQLQAAWPRWASAVAAGVFGPEPNLSFASPTWWVGGVHARVLVATAYNDRVIPLEQARGYASALVAAHPDAYVDVVELPLPTPAAPTLPFVHGSATPDAVATYRAREEALVAPLVGGP